MKVAFIIIAFALLISLNSYIWIRGWQALPDISSVRITYVSSMIALFLTMIIVMIFGQFMNPTIAKVASFIGYTYVILLVYLMFSFVAVDVIRIANNYINFMPSGMVAFRQWVMLVTLAITGISLIVGNYKFNHPAVVTLNISSEKKLNGNQLKIVAASDIHLGVSIDKKRLKSYVKLINDQHPDIVLLAGDISDRSIIPIERQNMAEEIRSIKAKYGVFAINGNHERYAERPNAMANYLKSAGVKVLRDEAQLVGNGFFVIGRDDKSNLNRKKLSEIMSAVDKNKLCILMDHQPYNLEEAEQNNIDFQISGHTHNGQFFPMNLIVKRMYEQGYGYLKKGATHYYISSGLGLWGPQYRIGTQSEIVVVNIK
jgi:predicted MPP superfamily phosphohydrolase